MKLLYAVAFATALTAAPISFAADTTEHEGHHPDAPAAKSAQNKPVTSNVANGQVMQMDTQMKTMHEMHEKMMTAKTPEARNALMAEHMRTMQDAMSTMNGMMAGKADNPLATSPQMMQKKMDMMQTMMQMMMDRMTLPAPTK